MRTYRSAILLFLLIQTLVGAPAQAQILKILTLNFNAEPVPEDKGNLLRDPRMAGIVDWVAQNDPDIIAIQEGWNYRGSPSMVIPLANAIGYDYTYRISMGAPLVLYSSEGILAKKKFHLDEREDFSLLHNAPWIGDGKTWVVVFGPVSWAVGARLTLDDGSPLYAFTGHLVATTQPDRDDQILGMDQSAQRKVAENGEDWNKSNVLLLGDFNSHPDAPGNQELGTRGYQNTFADAHPGVNACSNCQDPAAPMFNPMTIAPGQFPAQNTILPSEWIDYIWARGPAVKTLASTLTFTAPVNGVWMSDHYGVTSFVSVGDAAGPADVPNPIIDREDQPGPSQIVHITDELMSCDTLQCIHEMGDLQISAERGMTFVNDSHTPFRVECDSDGHVWPRGFASLDPGQAAAFFYDPGHDYHFVVTKGSYLRVRGLAHAE